ncbi:MAG TPA: GNAT family N-acetyltransferase [Gemmatimonadaceae bacterium]|nr:GNAT family N-acetyltransferase [Gemmatimonadaceae bacterium]
MTKPELRVEPLGEAEFGSWNEFVAAVPSGSIYSRTEYLDALCTAAGGRFTVLAARRGDLLVGGVALYERDGRFGRYVSPRSLLYYNGPVIRPSGSRYPSEHTAESIKTLTALEAAIRAREYASVLLKPRPVLADVRPFLAAGWRPTVGYTYVVSIADLEQARARIEQNLRRLIDRCSRSNFAITDEGDFDGFFRLHAMTMERVGAPVYLPAAAFRAFYETLSRQGLARLFSACLPDEGGKVVATQLVLLGHPVTHTVSAGADPEHMKSGVTSLLRWEAFARLSAGGYVANDLTDATLNAVTHFKSQLGGTLEPWFELRSPESLPFRWGTRISRAVQVSRAVAGAAVRRARGATQKHSNE